MIFANSFREFECGESEQFEKRVLLNDLFLRIRDGLTEMIIRTIVNFFYHNILLLIKVHIQNRSSEPGLTKIFLAVFLQLYDLALSLLTYPLNSDLSGG